MPEKMQDVQRSLFFVVPVGDADQSVRCTTVIPHILLQKTLLCTGHGAVGAYALGLSSWKKFL
jgi:hypothetical protein